MMKSSRSPADFNLLRCWAWAGYDNEKIFNRMKKEWRSEVTTLAGRLHCAHCTQLITINACIECGQTIYEGEST
jgi:uncharacterized protein Usg